MLGPDHPDVGVRVDNLAALAFFRHDWPTALTYYRRAPAMTIARSKRDRIVTYPGSEAMAHAALVDARLLFVRLIQTAALIGDQEIGLRAKFVEEMFQFAQWAEQTVTAIALSHMSARVGVNNPALARLARERQGLVGKWQARDKQLIIAISREPSQRVQAAELEQRARLAEISLRLSEIDKILADRFPEYTALVNPDPLSIAETQQLLEPGEAMVVFLDAPDFGARRGETFVWAVTKTDHRWLRIELGTKALTERVAALRCGLDRDKVWERSSENRRWLPRNPACMS